MTARLYDAPDCAGRNGVQDHGNHTPGPWAVTQKTCIGGTSPCVDDENGNQVASLACCANASANARLIAAAPDMLEALRAIVARSNNDPLGTSKVNDMRSIALAAIRRATGAA